MGTLEFTVEAKSVPKTVEAAPTSVEPTGDPYTYRIIGSVTGLEDEVGDIVVPGAFKSTLKKRIPKVIEAHAWDKPIGKVLEIDELLPGNKDLPATTAQGDPWPKVAGALVAKVQLFRTPQGEAAKIRWDGYGADQQFSIGYRAKRATKDKKGIRSLHEIDLFEISDVLWGAMPLAGPMPAALAAKVIAGMGEIEVKGADGTGVITDPSVDGDEWKDADPAALFEAAKDAIDWTEVDEAAAAHGDLNSGDEISSEPPPALNSGDDAGDGAGDEAAHQPLDDGSGPGEGKRYLDPADLEAAMAVLGDDSESKRAFTAAAGQKVVVAQDLGMPKITDQASLVAAIQLVRDADDEAAAKKTVVTAARKLGLEDVLPAEWVDASDDAEGKAAGGADKNKGGAEKLRRYWVDGPGAAKIGWGTPGDYMRCVKELTPHMGVRAHGYCQLRHFDALGVYAGQEKTAEVPDAPDGLDAPDVPVVEPTPLLDAWAPDAEVGDLAAHRDPPPPEAKGVTVEEWPGTLEERRDKVRDAVNVALRGAQRLNVGSAGGIRYEWDHVGVQGTWPDHVVATRSNWDGDHDNCESFMVPYTIDSDGNVTLGDPQPVRLQAMIVPGTKDAEVPPSPVPGMIDDAAYVVQAIRSVEGKAGRMLSGQNSDRIKRAVVTLLGVLLDAGVEIDPPHPPAGEASGRQEGEPVTVPDTTSPGAREGKSEDLPDGKMVLPAAALAEGLALLGHSVR